MSEETKGRKRLSPQEKMLRSTNMVDRPLSHEPPQMPTWLDEYGREEWNRVVPPLVEAGLVNVLDTSMLGAYCHQYSMFRQLQARVIAEGILTENGNLHPAQKGLEQVLTKLHKLATNFGFSMSSRGRMKTAPPSDTESDELDDFI